MATNMFSLEGKTALVTGGATGIGQALAAALAEAGANVAVTVHASPAEHTAALVAATGRKFHAVRCELADADPQAVLADVAGALGQVDILVNNAGIIRRDEAASYSDEDWQAVLDVNLNAVWRLSRAAGAQMLTRGGGKIINIASLLSFQGGIRVPAYTASKHAVVGLTKALANEWSARGVNVNCIAPGYIATANTAALRADETRNRQILERIPAGRWGEAADLAGAAVFLASPAAAYVHGHVLAVDGGWLAR
ncbi:2-dehydro-3-deoxy-D-gluconate 5-dehydrogenase KduD [Pseudoduganella namucuonensis]|uniref:2-deoxy-D-gluconate 3-dehydrogenase n=1 Tax=Pseudoduganella namucuonensis TaxID=1035707 RepID=A0A1I7M5Z0_9BURK|nr:2-dehydro-3-deoxy-D-gluconate 5-dehydrogenase KduD [Pseudoduganella namucuonensis]SFV17371.1 2-deoxy-D-gluconate 3-dehydrogenase [Pseudoduganella namucuonensis]